MRTEEQYKQRALLLRLRLKHKYDLIQHLNLDNILAEIALCDRLGRNYYEEYL